MLDGLEGDVRRLMRPGSDPDVILKAVDRMLKITERRSRLCGTTTEEVPTVRIIFPGVNTECL